MLASSGWNVMYVSSGTAVKVFRYLINLSDEHIIISYFIILCIFPNIKYTWSFLIITYSAKRFLNLNLKYLGLKALKEKLKSCQHNMIDDENAKVFIKIKSYLKNTFLCIQHKHPKNEVSICYSKMKNFILDEI